MVCRFAEKCCCFDGPLPPPLAIPTLPKNPLTVLTAIKDSTFGLNAVGICSRAKIEKQARYSVRLPKVSESGARIRGPMPRKMTKPVVAPTTMLSLVLRSCAISDIPGVNMLEASGERTLNSVVSFMLMGVTRLTATYWT